MKRVILIFFGMALLLIGCIKEDLDDCNAILRLTFQHENSVEKFDQVIGNDVYANIYKGDNLHSTVKIPYEEIQNGKEYILKKAFSGQLYITAWAVPRAGDPEMIPDSKEQRRFSESTIGHKDITRSDLPVCMPMSNLYLGILDSNEDVMEDSHHTIFMSNTICRVEVIVEPASIIDPYLSYGDPVVNVGGCSRGATLALKPVGEEILVFSDISKDAVRNIYSTGYFGLMPSYEEKTITVTVFCGDKKLLFLDSGELSEPGKEVTVSVRGSTAEIKINGWRKRIVDITL